MGGSSQPQTQTTTTVLSPEQKQLMGLAMPGVTEFAAHTPTRYGGSAIAGFDPSQVAGQEAALTAGGQQTGLANQAAGAQSQWFGPNALDISQNPNVQSAIETATRPVQEQLTRYGLPAIRASAEQSGNFGSSRQGIAEGLAIEGAQKASGDIASRISSDAYKTNVDAQLKALGLLPSTVGTLPSGALTTSGVGDVRQGMTQAQLGEQVSNFNYDQMAPYLQSRDIMSLLSGIPGGSTTSTASLPSKNPLTGALGGAASGAALGASLGSVVPGVGNLAGAGVGAGIGGLLPFLNS